MDALDNIEYTPIVATTEKQAPSGAGHEELMRQGNLIGGLLARVTDDHSDLSEFDIYLAGPDSVANAAEFFFLDQGVPHTQLFVERLR